MKNLWIEKNNNKNLDQIKDYILLMLGAPVVKIELDTQHLIFAIEMTQDLIEAYETMPENHRTELLPDKMRTELLKQGSLAHAKLILGRIRSTVMASYDNIQSAEIMIKEAIHDLNKFKGNIAWIFS